MSEPGETFVVVHGADAERRPLFSVLLKRTYAIGENSVLTRVARKCDFVRTDQYYDRGDPEWSTVQFESELAPFKPFTDVVLIGNAHAPSGRPVAQMDVSLSVRGRSKTIRVIGDRYCHYRAGRPPTFTDPTPFTSMPIRYDRAFGGSDTVSAPQTPITYARNDRGCGLVVRNVRDQVEGMSLPNLEDPNELLTPENLFVEDPYRWNDLPLPQGFGWVQRGWYPRSSFVGTMPPYLHPDQVMREEVLRQVPKGQVALSRQMKLASYHPIFNNGASSGLMFESLAGDEPIQLSGLTPQGSLRFSLPAERPTMTLDTGQGEQMLAPCLHTVCIRPEDREVDLIWRGAQVHPGMTWLARMTRLDARVS